MKRKIFVGLLAVVVLMGLIGCATFIKNSYVTLNSSKDFYYTAMGIVAELQVQKLIDQAKRDQINKIAKVYKEAHNTAVDALEVYEKTSLASDKEKVTTAIANAVDKWAQVAALINAIKPNAVPSALPK